jgi:arsenate reductase
MAEGFLKHLYGDRYEVYSAGTEPGEIHPLAIEVMGEVGVDIRGQRSKSVDAFSGWEFDLVVTVCDSARERCPVFFGKGKRIHKSFPDPAGVSGSEEERREAFRRVRDAIHRFIQEEFRGEGKKRLGAILRFDLP